MDYLNLYSHSLYHPQIWFNKPFMYIVLIWVTGDSFLYQSRWLFEMKKGNGVCLCKKRQYVQVFDPDICKWFSVCCGSELLLQMGFIFYQDGSFLKNMLEIRLGIFYRAKCKITYLGVMLLQEKNPVICGVWDMHLFTRISVIVFQKVFLN